MTRHKRHSHTNGGRRYTTTESSNGRVTNSSSFKSGNTRVTQTNDNMGHSYTTITTQYGDGSYESKRLGVQSKAPRNHAEPLREYSWQRERDLPKMDFEFRDKFMMYVMIGLFIFFIIAVIG